MREILFRGKRVDNNAWIKGPYIPSYASGYIYLADKHPKMVLIHKETVGQYTGQKDKCGNMIFEGDILESRASENQDDWKKWVCTFAEGAFVAERATLRKSKRPSSIFETIICADEIELYGFHVIGNIHDNPEMVF